MIRIINILFCIAEFANNLEIHTGIDNKSPVSASRCVMAKARQIDAHVCRKGSIEIRMVQHVDRIQPNLDFCYQHQLLVELAYPSCRLDQACPPFLI